jgi:hypothetical protein
MSFRLRRPIVLRVEGGQGEKRLRHLRTGSPKFLRGVAAGGEVVRLDQRLHVGERHGKRLRRRRRSGWCRRGWCCRGRRRSGSGRRGRCSRGRRAGLRRRGTGRQLRGVGALARALGALRPDARRRHGSAQARLGLRSLRAWLRRGPAATRSLHRGLQARRRGGLLAGARLGRRRRRGAEEGHEFLAQIGRAACGRARLLWGGRCGRCGKRRCGRGGGLHGRRGRRRWRVACSRLARRLSESPGRDQGRGGEDGSEGDAFDHGNLHRERHRSADSSPCPGRRCGARDLSASRRLQSAPAPARPAPRPHEAA